jgi:enoyl-[acyl-carrier protein] reductase I
MARLAEPLMTNGGALLTMSYYGADKVVNHYNIMGPVKASLEATVRYLSAELEPPEHRDGLKAATKAKADASTEHFDGKTTE